MIAPAMVALLAGGGAYAAAERSGRSPELWLILNAGIVLASYYVASLAMQGLAGTNDIYTSSGSAFAMVLVFAAPVAGALCGLATIAWLLRSPKRPSIASPVHMLSRTNDGEMEQVTVRFESAAFFVRRGDNEQRIELSAIASAEVDGEYLVVQVKDGSDPLRMRPVGEAHRDRQRAVALVRALAARLRNA